MWFLIHSIQCVLTRVNAKAGWSEGHLIRFILMSNVSIAGSPLWRVFRRCTFKVRQKSCRVNVNAIRTLVMRPIGYTELV